MDQKYGEFVGVDNLHYAIVTANTDDTYTTGVPKKLAPVAEIASETETNNKTTYYDNSAANNYVTEGMTTVQIIIPNLDAETLAEILGKTYLAGIVWDGGQAEPPEVAIGFRYNMGKDNYRYYWYHVGTFAGGAEEAKSKEADVEVKTYTLTYTAVTTAKEFTVGGKSIRLKRAFTDSADAETTTPETWFQSVKMPGA